MVESEGKPWITFFPCMANPSENCVYCRLLSTNVNNLRDLRWNRYVRFIFSHEVADDPPSLQQLVDLLFRMNSDNPFIHSDAFGHLIPISAELKKMGETMAHKRREHVKKISGTDDL